MKISRNKKKYLPKAICFTVLIMIFAEIITAQNNVLINDDCNFSIFINSSSNYCSRDGAFSNLGAKSDSLISLSSIECSSIQRENGVWFSFVPGLSGAVIRVFGTGYGGTIKNPKIVIFESCGNYIACSPGKDVGLDQLLFDDFTPGKTYYIMIESSIGGEGTFQLCIDNFVPVRAPESDCSKAVVLCSKTSFSVNKLEGNGSDKDELEPGICIGKESASAWYKWTCETAGRLTFTLTPNNNFPNQITDDIDFVLYELPNGIDDCSYKKILRCEGAGANADGLGNTLPLSQWSTCNGPTGLRDGETDFSEPSNCMGNNNNFVQPINMEAGKSYALLVNNFSRSGLGFSVDFGGNGSFIGENIDFTFDIQGNKICNETSKIILDPITLSGDSIIKIDWTFGATSFPLKASGYGPFDIKYGGFGEKTVVAKVETARGCRISKQKSFSIKECCDSLKFLTLHVEKMDVFCFSDTSGTIKLFGSGGDPEYSYAINNQSLQSSSLFNNLSVGRYSVIVYDKLGCINSSFIEIKDVNPASLELQTIPPEKFRDTICLNDYTQSVTLGINSNGFENSFRPEILITNNGLEVDRLIFEPAKVGVGNFIIKVETVYKNCIVSDSLMFTVSKCFDCKDILRLPTIILPEVNNLNSTLRFTDDENYSGKNQLWIYNRWGTEIFYSSGYQNDWNGEGYQSGIYFYVLKACDLVYKKTLTIMR
jgi:CHU_C Type IX secretion signal domain